MPGLGQRAVFVDGVEFTQELEATGDGLLGWRVDERKSFDLTQLEADHSQNDLGQVGALDLGLRVFWPREEILLRVETHADAVLDASTTSFSLPSAALRDRFDR